MSCVDLSQSYCELLQRDSDKISNSRANYVVKFTEQLNLFSTFILKSSPIVIEQDM